MIVTVPQQYNFTRFICLMVMSFLLGVQLIPLIRLAYNVDPTSVTRYASTLRLSQVEIIKYTYYTYFIFESKLRLKYVKKSSDWFFIQYA